MLLVPLSLSAQEVEKAEESESHAEQSEGEFNMKDLIFGHIGDAYSWHICTIGGTHISFPLPCIVYDNDELKVFMSTKLGHEGHYTEYEGLKIEEKGDLAGKIVRVSDGVRPLDFSITKNVLALFVSCGLMLWVFLSIAKKYREDYENKDMKEWKKPTGMQAYLEPIIIMLEKDIIAPSIGKDYKKFMPYLMTVFFFIIINNFLGLIPSGANLTGNIAITLVLALLTFLITNIFATKHYWLDIVNPEVPTWLKLPIPIMPLVEVIGVITKPFALCVRLFANMLAGHLTPLVLIGMVFIFAQMSVGASCGIAIFSCFIIIFMMLLECLVCFIQAYVFTLLSAIFIGLGQVHPHKD